MTADTPDHHQYWTTRYGDTPARQPQPAEFLAACLPRLTPGSAILELGCGGGTDSDVIARAGHTLLATDFVGTVIDYNRVRYKGVPNLTFEEMRIDEPYPFPDRTFDAVYAHLTLHYYTHDITKRVFREIHRVLKPGGWLMFACKSPGDPEWGLGVEIEPDMFDLNGKIRHFFTEDYARHLLDDDFGEVEVASRTGELYGVPSAWVTAIARAR